VQSVIRCRELSARSPVGPRSHCFTAPERVAQTQLVPTYLHELPVADRDAGSDAFRRLPQIERLDWPEGVVEQWLYDHGHHSAFLDDYGNVDLDEVQWTLELVPLTELAVMPTGPSEEDFLNEVAIDHVHYLGVRPQPIQDTWSQSGTWLVPPVLLDRRLLTPSASGLQVVEGRMRTGILQGRFHAGLEVADQHEAWVGRRK
jgi:hypothetical protein